MIEGLNVTTTYYLPADIAQREARVHQIIAQALRRVQAEQGE